ELYRRELRSLAPRLVVIAYGVNDVDRYRFFRDDPAPDKTAFADASSADPLAGFLVAPPARPGRAPRRQGPARAPRAPPPARPPPSRGRMGRPWCSSTRRLPIPGFRRPPPPKHGAARWTSPPDGPPWPPAAFPPPRTRSGRPSSPIPPNATRSTA